jgi:hypothetical protein
MCCTMPVRPKTRPLTPPLTTHKGGEAQDARQRPMAHMQQVFHKQLDIRTEWLIQYSKQPGHLFSEEH